MSDNAAIHLTPLTDDQFYSSPTPEQIAETQCSIPHEYGCKVIFSSAGQLSAPPVLHFRNFTPAETISLQRSADTPDIVFTLINVLNSMCYEEFDCGNLHASELIELMMYIYGAHWGSRILQQPYYVDPDIEDTKKLNSDKNIRYADIPISAIKTTPIMQGFKEPIKFEYQGITYKFRLQRLKDIGLARAHVYKKFSYESRKFSDVAAKLQYNKTTENPEHHKFVDITDRLAYEDYQVRQHDEFTLALQVMTLIGINDRELSSLDEKLEVLSKMDPRIIKEFADWANNFPEFGIDQNITFIDAFGKELTRRFSFRLSTLVSAVVDGRLPSSDFRISF